MFNLFEFYVLSVINYCSEVLGYDQCDTIERAHCFVNGLLMINPLQIRLHCIANWKDFYCILKDTSERLKGPFHRFWHILKFFIK
jgi:hypothetical protein